MKTNISITEKPAIAVSGGYVPLVHGSLFSGIGGFDLAAEWMGWKNAFHCDWKEFGQQNLKNYWPNATTYSDITTTDFTIHRGNIDIVTGGFPCQPYSQSGQRKGTEDDRHLWPEMLRAIREIQPRFVVGENVRGLTNWNRGLVFDEVQADLENEGYEVTPFLLPASGVDAPHQRYRIWFVAYSQSRSWNLSEKSRVGEKEFYANGNGAAGNAADTTGGRLERSRHEGLCDKKKQSEFARFSAERTFTNSNGFGLWDEIDRIRKSGQFNEARSQLDWSNFPTQSPICTGDDGFPTESLRQRIREDSLGYLSDKEIDKIISKARTEWRNKTIEAAGNAIVPKVALQIFRSIDLFARFSSGT